MAIRVVAKNDWQVSFVWKVVSFKRENVLDSVIGHPEKPEIL